MMEVEVVLEMLSKSWVVLISVIERVELMLRTELVLMSMIELDVVLDLS